MISILIPTYNYNVYNLVSIVQKQVEQTGIEYEIICLDDASKLIFLENEKINELPYSTYKKLDTNIGRSKIRNLLAQKARFDWLLYLDADVLPKEDRFISEYMKYINDEEKIVNGGLLYREEKPEKEQLLRWIYGRKREALAAELRQKEPYRSFLTLNFLIHKSIFKEVSFDETIPNFRHEDTLFSYTLMQKKISIMHINNPIYHLGLDDFDYAIQKEKESLTALKYLIDNALLSTNYLRISKLFASLKQFKLVVAFSFFYKISQFLILKNLSSTAPSLFIFDLYRLGYLCNIENK